MEVIKVVLPLKMMARCETEQPIIEGIRKGT
jgi:hypothetical protein